MTYVNGTVEIKKYLQALRGVQVDQGNLSVPKERKMRSLLVVQLRTEVTTSENLSICFFIVGSQFDHEDRAIIMAC